MTVVFAILYLLVHVLILVVLGQAQTDHGSAHRLAHARPSSL